MLRYSSTTSPVLCTIMVIRIDFRTLYAHQHRFIIIALCLCLLNHIVGKSHTQENSYFNRYLYCWSLFLHVNSSYCLVSFISAWSTPFSIFCREGLLVRNSLHFVYLGMSWFFLYFWRIFLPDIGFLVYKFFSFSTLKINPWSSVLPGFWWEMAVNLTEETLCVISCLSLAIFTIPALIFNSLIMMCLG